MISNFKYLSPIAEAYLSMRSGRAVVSESFFPDAIDDIASADTYSVISEFESDRRDALGGRNALPTDFGTDVRAYNAAMERELPRLLTLAESGRFRLKWELIDPFQYKNALLAFMRDGESFRFSATVIREWLKIILKNTLLLEELTSLSGHSMGCNVDGVRDYYFGDDEIGELFIPDDWGGMYDFLYHRGFDYWCRLPDGSSAISDYGIRPIADILSSLPYEPSASESIVAINRCLDVTHHRGDLASAFIKGGSESLTAISNESAQVRYAGFSMDEAYERVPSEMGRKTRFGSLEEEFPHVTDEDVMRVIESGIGLGIARVALEFPIFAPSATDTVHTRRRHTAAKRSVMPLVGYVSKSFDPSHPPSEPMRFEDAVTNESDDRLSVPISSGLDEDAMTKVGNSVVSACGSGILLGDAIVHFTPTYSYMGKTTGFYDLGSIAAAMMNDMESNGLAAKLPEIAAKVAKGKQMTYGRNRDEVRMSEPVFDQLKRFGDSLGLDVYAEYGERRTEDFAGIAMNDAADLDYVTFKEIHALKSLLKFVSVSLFRDWKRPATTMTAEQQMEFLRRMRDETYAKFVREGGMEGVWYVDRLNDNRSMGVAADGILELQRRFHNGMANGARLISNQTNSVDEPLHSVISKDIAMLSEHVSDGYHTGVHWGADYKWFYDRGDWVDGMSYFVLQGRIPLSSVNFDRTAATNYEFTGERELWLFGGRPIFEPSVKYVTNKIEIYITPKDRSKVFIS